MRSDKILSDQGVQHLIMDSSLPEDDQIIYFVEPDYDQSSAWLSPFVAMEFIKNPKLGMIYGTEEGYIWISSEALRKIQSLPSEKTEAIRYYRKLIQALKSIGYTIKQLGLGNSG